MSPDKYFSGAKSYHVAAINCQQRKTDKKARARPFSGTGVIPTTVWTPCVYYHARGQGAQLRPRVGESCYS